ncbi:hypothetical protein [Komagataeibacter kakiaceti]|uniref:hypothetical protein n=1 Tax=Komagataeibacter kakiaceti TaxID=943261 RepID=UPI001F5711B9|nr:hypothetical protein [Komagataeibacter kakiaceti]
MWPRSSPFGDDGINRNNRAIMELGRHFQPPVTRMGGLRHGGHGLGQHGVNHGVLPDPRPRHVRA